MEQETTHCDGWLQLQVCHSRSLHIYAHHRKGVTIHVDDMLACASTEQEMNILEEDL